MIENPILRAILEDHHFSSTGLRTLFSKICQLMKQLVNVPNTILGAAAADGDFDCEDDDDELMMIMIAIKIMNIEYMWQTSLLSFK